MKYKALSKSYFKKIGKHKVKGYIYKRIGQSESSPLYFLIIPKKEAEKVSNIFPVVAQDNIDHTAEILDREDFDVPDCMLQGDSIDDIDENLNLWISMSEE